MSSPAFDPAAGSAQWFATAHWSVVLTAGQSASPNASNALEKLCRTYWYPLYAFLRRQGRTDEDAQDLTQEFFARFLEKEFIGLADPKRGRFRSFLLACLKNFSAEQHRYAGRLLERLVGHTSWVSDLTKLLRICVKVSSTLLARRGRRATAP